MVRVPDLSRRAPITKATVCGFLFPFSVCLSHIWLTITDEIQAPFDLLHLEFRARHLLGWRRRFVNKSLDSKKPQKERICVLNAAYLPCIRLHGVLQFELSGYRRIYSIVTLHQTLYGVILCEAYTYWRAPEAQGTKVFHRSLPYISDPKKILWVAVTIRRKGFCLVFTDVTSSNNTHFRSLA